MADGELKIKKDRPNFGNIYHNNNKIFVQSYKNMSYFAEFLSILGPDKIYFQHMKTSDIFPRLPMKVLEQTAEAIRKTAESTCWKMQLLKLFSMFQVLAITNK